MQGQLTDKEYWNRVWRRKGHVRKITPSDARYGEKGEFLGVVRRYIGEFRDLRVIELGGACSYHALALAKWWNAKVVIVDYSPIGLSITEKVFKLNDCEVEIMLGDFFDLQIRCEFDFVMHFGVLEHFLEIKPLLKVCSSLLRPNGKLLFGMPNTEAMGSHLWRRWSPNDWDKHIHHSNEDIQKACEVTGLDISRCFHFGPPMLQMSQWEHKGFGPTLVTNAQRCINLIWRLRFLRTVGHRRLSMYRGFVAMKN